MSCLIFVHYVFLVNPCNLFTQIMQGSVNGIEAIMLLHSFSEIIQKDMVKLNWYQTTAKRESDEYFLEMYCS